MYSINLKGNLYFYIHLLFRFGEPDSDSWSEEAPVVVGWGKTQTGKDFQINSVASQKQFKVEAPAVSNEKCKDSYEKALPNSRTIRWAIHMNTNAIIMFAK